ncbi:MAG: immunoglobulin domain-containing protein [Verrucomicrobiota bacterium]
MKALYQCVIRLAQSARMFHGGLDLPVRCKEIDHSAIRNPQSAIAAFRLLTSTATNIAVLAIVCGLSVTLAQAASPVATALGAYTEQVVVPTRLAVDAAGNLYVTDSKAGRVVVFNGFGQVTAVKSGFQKPLGIAVDGNGRIFVGEMQTGSVSVFDAQWNLLYKVGVGDTEFAMPNHLAIDAAPGGDILYVADSPANAIKAYRDGKFVFQLGGQGTNAAVFDFPTGVFVSAIGELFVVDQNNDQVQVFDRNGGLLRAFSLVTPLGGMGLGAAGGRSQGITGDAQGRLYVADSFQSIVRVFDSQGVYLSKIGALGDGVGQLATPTSVALDGYGRLFVAAPNNGRVEVFGLDSFNHVSVLPARPVVAAGSVVTLSVTAGGSGPFSYQWRKGGISLVDGGRISGATSGTLTLTGVMPPDSGNYSVYVTGPMGDFTSATAPLTVLVPLSITSITTNQMVVQGTNVLLTAGIAGDAPVIQWQFNGLDIPGATAYTFLLSNVTPDNSGKYSLVVNNAVSSTSAVTALKVITPPAPPRLDVTAHDPATGIQFTLTGIPGCTYYLDGSTNLIDWVNLSGVNNESGTVDIVVPDGDIQSRQFYRLRWVP